MNDPFKMTLAQHWDKPSETMDIIWKEVTEQTNQAHELPEVLALLALKIGVAFAKAESAASFIDEISKISVSS